MARVTLGPIVSDASGKTAGTVFSRWKGRNYVRRLVTPANPQSAAQTAQRNAMARCVELWRSLINLLKTALDKVGTGYQMSGYNWFCGQNVVDEKTYDAGKLMGHNPDVTSIQNFALAAGGAGEITVTWTDPDDGTATVMGVFYRKVEVDSEENEIQNGGSAAMNAETKTLAGLDTGELYRVYALPFNGATVEYGESDSAEQAAG